MKQLGMQILWKKQDMTVYFWPWKSDRKAACI